MLLMIVQVLQWQNSLCTVISLFDACSMQQACMPSVQINKASPPHLSFVICHRYCIVYLAVMTPV